MSTVTAWAAAPLRHLGYGESAPGALDGWAYRIDSEGADLAGPRVLLLGEDNPYSLDPRLALWPAPAGTSGDRLRRVLGLPYDAYYSLWRANLCSSGWNPTWAAITAANLLRAFDPRGAARPWDVVVCLGRKVSRACARVLGASLPTWGILRGARRHDAGAYPEVTVISIPHPSGTCRAWNDIGAVSRARDLLREVAPHVTWGSAP